MATAKNTELTFRIELGLKGVLVLAKPAIFLKGSLLPRTRFGVSRDWHDR